MPPPPPQTPDHEEKSGQPLQQRPGQKAGDFIERDLWNLDEDWEEGSGAPEATEADNAPAAPAEKPASSADDGTDQPADDDPGDAGESAAPTPDELPDDSAETIDSPTEDQEDDWEEFTEKEASGPEAASPPEEDDEQEPVTEDEPAAVLDAPEEVENAAEEDDLGDEPELDLGDDDATGEQDEEPPALASDPDTGSGTETETGDESELDSEWEPAAKSDPAPASDDTGATAGAADKGFDDEFLDPAPQPEALPESKTKPKRLSVVELVSLAIVLVAILAGAGWGLKTFFADIPTRKSQTLVPDFPVRGELVTVENATSFWREPIRSGPNPDTARRDAKLIPALDLNIKDVKSDGALRVFFRDESGRLIGDSVTHAVRNGIFVSTGNDQLQLAATAGFDDEGKHAAYQTAQTEPWTVEVFEGPEEGAAFESFELLFEMPVSAERR